MDLAEKSGQEAKGLGNVHQSKRESPQYPMCRYMAVLELTKKRVEELRRWVDGVEEGDVCSGSIKSLRSAWSIA